MNYRNASDLELLRQKSLFLIPLLHASVTLKKYYLATLLSLGFYAKQLKMGFFIIIMILRLNVVMLLTILITAMKLISGNFLGMYVLNLQLSKSDLLRRRSSET